MKSFLAALLLSALVAPTLANIASAQSNCTTTCNENFGTTTCTTSCW